jgi:subtilisin-like proprotein convertase family protein
VSELDQQQSPASFYASPAAARQADREEFLGPTGRSTSTFIRTLLATLLVLAAAAPASAAEVFDNAAPITIPDHGQATPYPSPIDVQGMTGRVTDVQVTLRGVTHPRPSDLDVLLVSPDGDMAVVMSDSCGDALQNANFVFSKTAPAHMPFTDGPCDQLFYVPTDYPGRDIWPGTTDVKDHAPDFTQFAGDNPNGTWSLYVYDDSTGSKGKINLGWALTLDTVAPDAMVPGDHTTGAGNPYPVTRAVSGVDGVITDVNVTVRASTTSAQMTSTWCSKGHGGRRSC